MEKFCTEENWKKTLDPLILIRPVPVTNETANMNQEQLPIVDGDKPDEPNDLKHSLSEGDKTESDNKKIKSDKVIFCFIPLNIDSACYDYLNKSRRVLEVNKNLRNTNTF